MKKRSDHDARDREGSAYVSVGLPRSDGGGSEGEGDSDDDGAGNWERLALAVSVVRTLTPERAARLLFHVLQAAAVVAAALATIAGVASGDGQGLAGCFAWAAVCALDVLEPVAERAAARRPMGPALRYFLRVVTVMAVYSAWCDPPRCLPWAVAVGAVVDCGFRLAKAAVGALGRTSDNALAPSGVIPCIDFDARAFTPGSLIAVPALMDALSCFCRHRTSPMGAVASALTVLFGLGYAALGWAWGLGYGRLPPPPPRPRGKRLPLKEWN